MFPPVSRGMEWHPPLHVPYRYSRLSRVGGDPPFPLPIEDTTEKQWPPTNEGRRIVRPLVFKVGHILLACSLNTLVVQAYKNVSSASYTEQLSQNHLVLESEKTREERFAHC